MLYEIKVNVEKPDDGGEMKVHKEHYILDAELHGEAEAAGYQLYDGMRGEVDVVAVFRSDIKEIVNNKEENKPFFKATVVDVTTDIDTGKEKEMKYSMLVCAKDIVEATDLMQEQLKQGYDMRLDAIRRVKILDYLRLV